MSAELTRRAWAAIGGASASVDQVEFEGTGIFRSVYAVGDFAAATIATAGLSVAELLAQLEGRAVAVKVDRRLASRFRQLSSDEFRNCRSRHAGLGRR